MKNRISVLCLVILTLNASQSPEHTCPGLRLSAHLSQEQEMSANSPRARLTLSARMRLLNPSLNLDVNQLLASANTITNINNQPPK